MPSQPIVSLVTDLMLQSRIRDALARMGASGIYPGTAAEAAAILSAGPVSLLIVDLGDVKLAGLEAIRHARERGVPVLAFGSHVDDATLGAARDAGANRVVPRSLFASRLPELIEEVEKAGSAR